VRKITAGMRLVHKLSSKEIQVSDSHTLIGLSLTLNNFRIQFLDYTQSYGRQLGSL
jgi:hypothetical protein